MFDFSKKLILFDRDGVINEDRHYFVTRPSDLYLLSNALRGIAKLSQAGFRIGICTNQSGIARGLYDEKILAQIHKKLCQRLSDFGGKIDHIIYCPSANDHHPNRKPNPGMLFEQARFFGVSLKGVPFVGDNWIDIEAARAAGASPVLVRTGKGKEVERKYRHQLADVHVYSNVECAAEMWLKELKHD